jgi:endonuclease/exonuclease/phosphatase family metal-dependent hydrolase
MATWAKLRDRRQPKAKPIVFFNTHFDHRGQQARLESARLLRRRVTELAGQCRVIVTGDFNAGEDSPPYLALFGAEGNHASPLRDAYRLLHPARAADEGTFSNFKAGAVNGALTGLAFRLNGRRWRPQLTAPNAGGAHHRIILR